MHVAVAFQRSSCQLQLAHVDGSANFAGRAEEVGYSPIHGTDSEPRKAPTWSHRCALRHEGELMQTSHADKVVSGLQNAR